MRLFVLERGCGVMRRNDSPTSSDNGLKQRSPLVTNTSASRSRGNTRNNCVRSTSSPHPPKAGNSLNSSSPPSRHARSPRSPALGGPSTSGATRSWATSPPAVRPTAAPKPSTASSNSPDASHAASATPKTTASAHSSSAEDSTYDPRPSTKSRLNHA